MRRVPESVTQLQPIQVVLGNLLQISSPKKLSRTWGAPFSWCQLFQTLVESSPFLTVVSTPARVQLDEEHDDVFVFCGLGEVSIEFD